MIYRAEGQEELQEAAQTYPVRVKPTGRLQLSDLKMDYLTSSNMGVVDDEKGEMIQALNIVLRHHL